MRTPIQAKCRRLFCPDPQFAERMAGKVDRVMELCSKWQKDGTGIPQGYTYLGQFLVHEITSRERPGTPASLRSRVLDLDSVYGPEASFDVAGKFVFTRAADGLANDLLRDRTTKAALIPEFRNDEHPIIAQLHLQIQLFHNAVVGAIGNSPIGQELGVRLRREEARRYVVATLQRIYDEEYLSAVGDCAIVRLHHQDRLRVFEIPKTEGQLPFEMTHAALRFGHSQVRENYLLNRGTKLELKALLAMSGAVAGSKYRGIPVEKAVNWRRFFEWDNDDCKFNFDLGQRINPKIVDVMFNLVEPPIPHIVQRNMEAAIREALPSGQSVAAALAGLDIDARIQPRLTLNPAEEELLRQHGLLDETPLWLYVLLEAHSLGGNGKQLGPVGTIFLCEAVRSALAGSEPYCVVHESCAEEYRLKPIRTFRDLVKFTHPGPYCDP